MEVVERQTQPGYLPPFLTHRGTQQLEREPHPMGSRVPTAASHHWPLPGADGGQGVGAPGPGEVRHRRHRFLLQSLQGEDVVMMMVIHSIYTC